MKMGVLNVAVLLICMVFMTLCDGSPLFKATRAKNKGNHSGISFSKKLQLRVKNVKQTQVLQTNMDENMSSTTENIISTNVDLYDDLNECMQGIQNDMEDDYGVGWSVIVVDTSDSDWTWTIYRDNYMYAQAQTESGEDREILVYNLPQSPSYK